MNTNHKYRVECITTLVEWIDIDAANCPSGTGGIIQKAKEIATNRYNSSIWQTEVQNISVSEILSTEKIYQNSELNVELSGHLENLSEIGHREIK